MILPDGVAERLHEMDPTTRAAVCQGMLWHQECVPYRGASYDPYRDVGLGASNTTAPDFAAFPVWARILSTVGLGMGIYHGYKRNHESVGWAIGWGLFGALLAPIAIPVMFIEGFGKPAK